MGSKSQCLSDIFDASQWTVVRMERDHHNPVVFSTKNELGHVHRDPVGFPDSVQFILRERGADLNSNGAVNVHYRDDTRSSFALNFTA